MDSRQAKDFFVEQVAQQAAIEGIPLSDLERRMMYFTEGPDAVEDPVQLDEEFEAQYGDSENYDFEKKGVTTSPQCVFAAQKRESAGRSRI